MRPQVLWGTLKSYYHLSQISWASYLSRSSRTLYLSLKPSGRFVNAFHPRISFPALGSEWKCCKSTSMIWKSHACRITNQGMNIARILRFYLELEERKVNFHLLLFGCWFFVVSVSLSNLLLFPFFSHVTQNNKKLFSLSHIGDVS